MNINFGRVDFTDAASVNAFMARLSRAFRSINKDGPIIIGGGAPITKHLSATATYDPPSIAAGAQTTTTVTVNGAALGDEVTCSFDKDLQGMQMTAYVSATDTVTVVIRNGTGGAIDLASGTLRVSAWQH